MKYRGSINKLSKLAFAQEEAIPNDDIPFVKSVEETLVQPESVQSNVMALLTLLTTDYNPDSKVMSGVVSKFNGENVPQSGPQGGKGVGYLRALGDVGKRVERGDWGNVFGGVGFQEGIYGKHHGAGAKRVGSEEGRSENVDTRAGKVDAILKTELDLLQTLHRSKYLLNLITECKTLTRKCKQYAQLSKNNDRDEGVARTWKEVRMDKGQSRGGRWGGCKNGTLDLNGSPPQHAPQTPPLKHLLTPPITPPFHLIFNCARCQLLICYRWCKEMVGEEVFFHNK